MNKLWIKVALIAVLVGSLGSFVSFAAVKMDSVLSSETEENEVVLYVKNPGTDGADVDCQIGNNDCKSIKISSISQETVPIKTIFLVDNSLSVVEKYRPMIADILVQLAANRMDREQFSVAVFSSEINYLLKDCDDYAQIKQVIDSITYQNQETYLTDVLYELLKTREEMNDTVFTRIVVVSDGVDNKAIGYTKEELYSLLKKQSCPIYTIGCTYNNNNEELKNMFALSRMTEGKSWLLDDVSDVMDVISGISELNDTLKVTITPKEEDCDGMEKGIRLKLIKGEDTVQYITEVRMPFGKAEETISISETLETVSDDGKIETETISTLQPVVKVKNSSGLVWVIAIIVIAFGLILAIVSILRKKSKEEPFKLAPETNYKDEAEKRSKRVTYVVNQEKVETSNHTRETNYAWRKMVELTDQNDPMKTFSAFLDSTAILVGYDAECQIQLNYDESISGNHCKIMEENGIIMVQNLSRTNPTIVNGNRINQKTELKTGDVLTMGRLNMKVVIKG